MTAALRKLIFVGCRELGLDDDTRRDLQLVATGKASLTDMSEPELEKVVDALKAKGFKVAKSASRKQKRARAPRRDIRLIHVLWTKLGEAGALRDPTRAGLNAFIRKRFANSWGYTPIDVDRLTEWRQIDDVVSALKDWGKREGIDFYWEAHRK